MARFAHSVAGARRPVCSMRTPPPWWHLAQFGRGQSNQGFHDRDAARSHSQCLRWARWAGALAPWLPKLGVALARSHRPVGRSSRLVQRAASPSARPRFQWPVFAHLVWETPPCCRPAWPRPCIRWARRHRSAYGLACRSSGRSRPRLPRLACVDVPERNLPPPARQGARTGYGTTPTETQASRSWRHQLHDLSHHCVVMPDPGVPALIEADELRPGNLACGVLRTGVRAVAIVARADDECRCADGRKR